MRLAALLVVGIGAAACSSASSSTSGDPADSGAAACPSLAGNCSKIVKANPSYARDVAPILQDNCVTCHSPKGGYGYNLVTYEEVHDQAGAMITWISDCTMPPSTYPPLETTQRQTLLDWLACGAPNN
jgi:hypothetical protein